MRLPLRIITPILDNATGQRVPGNGPPRHGEPSDRDGRGSTPLCPALTVSPMMREGSHPKAARKSLTPAYS